MTENQDVIQVSLDVATSELNPQGEGSFAKVNSLMVVYKT